MATTTAKATTSDDDRTAHAHLNVRILTDMYTLTKQFARMEMMDLELLRTRYTLVRPLCTNVPMTWNVK